MGIHGRPTENRELVTTHIVIERGEGSLLDRFRRYKVFIDGEFRGNIRHQEKWAFMVPAGTHTVSFRIAWFSSPPIKVTVVKRTRLICRSSVAHAFGLFSLLQPGSWITVREEDGASRSEPQNPGDAASEKTMARAKTAGDPTEAKPARRTPDASFRIAGPGTGDISHERRMLELDLRVAVATQAYDLHYVPQIDLRTQRVTGFEVEIRWHHSTQGLVPSAVFAAMAETLGLAAQLGQQVLAQACREATYWPEDIALAITKSRLAGDQQCHAADRHGGP